MTNEEFVANEGKKCPSCESERIASCCGSEVEATEDPIIVAAVMECRECGAEWNELLQMIGYELTEAESENGSKTADDES